MHTIGEDLKEPAAYSELLREGPDTSARMANTGEAEPDAGSGSALAGQAVVIRRHPSDIERLMPLLPVSRDVGRLQELLKATTLCQMIMPIAPGRVEQGLASLSPGGARISGEQ